jgi:signal transduction histidine kinase
LQSRILAPIRTLVPFLSNFLRSTKRSILTVVAVALALMVGFYWLWSEGIVRKVFPPKEQTARIGLRTLPAANDTGERADSGRLWMAVLNKAAERARIHLVWSEEKGGADEALNSGRIDLWPMLAATRARRSHFHISEPWIEEEYALISKVGKDLTSAAVARGKRVALPDFGAIRELAGTVLPRSDMVLKLNPTAVMQSVCLGESDYAFLDRQALRSELLNRPSECRDTNLKYVLIPGALLPFGVGSTLNSAWLADRIAVQIGGMAADGTLGGIQAHFSVTGSSGTERIRERIRVDNERRRLYLALVVLFIMLLALMAALRKFRTLVNAGKRANTEKALFLTRMTNQLRMPIHDAVGVVNLLLTTPLTASQTLLIQTVEGSAASILETLNNVVDYARIEAGSVELEQLDFDLYGLLEDLIDHYGQPAARKKIEITCHIAPGVPHIIKGDPVRLRQVLATLLSNAVKFTENGEVAVCARVVSRKENSIVLHFEVRDTGAGIPLDNRAHLFKSFKDLDVNSGFAGNGMGLGLAIAKQIVTRHGGHIDFESEPGEGSAFWTVLGFKRAGAAYPTVEIPACLSAKRVLIAAPSSYLRRMLVAQTKSFGMECSEAVAMDEIQPMLNAGQEGHPFDVLVLDELFAGQGFPGIPTILLTNSNSPDFQAEVTLCKPLRYSRYKRALVEIVQQESAPRSDLNALLARIRYANLDNTPIGLPTRLSNPSS